MATINKTGSTKKPSGLSVVRNGGLKFVVSWKIGDKDYNAGHQLQWRAYKSEKKHTGWTTIDMGSSATSKTITLTTANWFPTSGRPKLCAFEFQVRGKRAQTSETTDGNTTVTKYEWSGWTGKKWDMKVPNRPSLTSELTASYTTVFTWEGNNSPDDEKPFTKYQWQTCLKKDCKETNGKNITGWGSITSENASGSETPGEGSGGGEDSAVVATGSHTRWFRVRSVGPAGYSDWRYARHVYAKPKKPTIKSVTIKKSGGNTNVLVSWKAPSDAAHPIDKTTVEYHFEKATSYSGTGTEGITIDDTPGTDSASFMISDTADTDEVLFVRVVNKHDIDVNTGNWEASAWKPVDYGTLETPSVPAGQDFVNITSTTTASFTLANASLLTSSKIAIVYRDTKGKDIVVAVDSGYPSQGNTMKTISGVAIPNTPERAKAKFYIYAFIGTYSAKTRKDGVTAYTIDAETRSSGVYDTATTPSVPVAPTNVTVTRSGDEACITWDRNWKDSTKTELSWSTAYHAWQSTTQPQTYVIEDKYTHKWYIPGITAGEVWYFRVRFIDDSDEEVIYSPYCDRVVLDRTAKPDTPILKVSKATVKPGGKIKASWIYECDDGIKQASAELCVVINEGLQNEQRLVIAKTETNKSISFTVNMLSPGTTYYLSLRVTSKRGKASDWSESVPLYVGDPVTCAISQTNIASATVEDSDGETRTANVLDALPLTATITGAGTGGTTTLIIERLDDYHMERPDGSFKDGYAGETIVNYQQTGESQISIDRDELIGVLDDGAKYRMIATAEDGNSQSDSDEMTFEVHWDHQAEAPKNTSAVTIINGVAKITPVAPDSAVSGDTCDIYRLSADNPQLIVQGGTFGEDYADPYPTIGEHGGYRIVDVTKYGDYITATNQPAWIDIPTNLSSKTGFIHFGSESIPLDFNVELSSSWSKDFKETKYLGGSVRGDWNPAVSRTGSVSVTILAADKEKIQAMRRLADYPGICHIRTQDGSSFAADVQVSGNTGYNVAGKVETYLLTITRIDPQELDGILYDELVIT